jgi:uncharacterized protein DUF1840
MLITFESNAHTDVTMFADIAKSLIKSMGHSGTIPSAIAAKDIPAALEQLKEALDADTPEDVKQVINEDDEETEVSLSGRAFPLVEMLKAAAKKNEPIMWYEKKS